MEESDYHHTEIEEACEVSKVNDLGLVTKCEMKHVTHSCFFADGDDSCYGYHA